MMTDTRDKLLETKYFLERMIEKQTDQDAFKYNLSAFLSAARSVTLIMQKEFAKVSSFKKWYTEKQTEMKSDKTMKLLNEKRSMTIHVQPVSPLAHVDITIVVPTLSITMTTYPPTVIVTRADGTIERMESEPPPSTLPSKTEVIPAKGETTEEWQWYFEDLLDKDVVTVCKEHIVKLEAFVKECESRFVSDE